MMVDDDHDDDLLGLNTCANTVYRISHNHMAYKDIHARTQPITTYEQHSVK